MRDGIGCVVLFAGAILVPSASAVAADHPETRPFPFGAPEWGSWTVAPETEALPTRTPDLRLVFFDPKEALPAGADAMAHEVQAIFRELGVSVGWKSGALGTTFGGGPVPEVAVILLPHDPVRERENSRVMGLVMRNQEPNRAIWVFLSNVRWTLGLAPKGRKNAPASEGQVVGIALGRIVAHELIHAVAPEEPHAAGGLMHHSLDRGFLRAKQVSIDGRCARAFLARLTARITPEGPAQAAVVPGP